MNRSKGEISFLRSSFRICLTNLLFCPVIKNPSDVTGAVIGLDFIKSRPFLNAVKIYKTCHNNVLTLLQKVSYLLFYARKTDITAFMRFPCFLVNIRANDWRIDKDFPFAEIRSENIFDKSVLIPSTTTSTVNISFMDGPSMNNIMGPKLTCGIVFKPYVVIFFLQTFQCCCALASFGDDNIFNGKII